MPKFVSFPFAVTCALLGATIGLTSAVARRVPEQLALPLEGIAADISGWHAIHDTALNPATVKTLDATSYLSRVYERAGSNLELFVAFYSQQRAGESMHSPKHCLPGSGWEIWRHDSAPVSVEGSQVEVNKYSIQHAGDRMLMFYWYQSKDRIIASEYMGKLLLARDAFSTGRTAGSIVRISIRDIPGADADGIAFASKLIPQVRRCFTGI